MDHDSLICESLVDLISNQKRIKLFRAMEYSEICPKALPRAFLNNWKGESQFWQRVRIICSIGFVKTSLYINLFKRKERLQHINPNLALFLCARDSFFPNLGFQIFNVLFWKSDVARAKSESFLQYDEILNNKYMMVYENRPSKMKFFRCQGVFFVNLDFKNGC